MIYCLGFSGKPLNDKTRDLISKAAFEMLEKQVDKKAIKTDGCEGRVTTEFEFASLLGVYGTAFSADLETEEGHTEVDFILHDCARVAVEVRQREARASKACMN